MRRETAKNIKDPLKFVKTLFTKEKGENLKTSSQEPETQKESSRCAKGVSQVKQGPVDEMGEFGKTDHEIWGQVG